MYAPAMNSDVSVVGTLLLSPIKELESGSVNSSLNTSNPATTALAKSILSSNLQQSGWYYQPVDKSGRCRWRKMKVSDLHVVVLSGTSPYNNTSVSNITELASFAADDETGKNSTAILPAVVFPTSLTSTENGMKVATLPRSLAKSSSNVIITELTESDTDNVDATATKGTLSRESSNATTNSTHSTLETFTGTIAGLFKPAESVRSTGKKSDSKTGEVYV